MKRLLPLHELDTFHTDATCYESEMRLFGVDAKIGGDTGYAGTANRDLCKELGIQTFLNSITPLCMAW